MILIFNCPLEFAKYRRTLFVTLIYSFSISCAVSCMCFILNMIWKSNILLNHDLTLGVGGRQRGGKTSKRMSVQDHRRSGPEGIISTFSLKPLTRCWQ